MALSIKNKRIIAVILAVAVLLGLLFTFYVCGSMPPELEEIYDRVVELVESSYRFNTVFLGEGLPVYARDSDYAGVENLYYGSLNVAGYELVSDYSTFHSIDAIKVEAEKIYSKKFLEDVWFTPAFDGYAYDDNAGGTVERAWYYESNGVLYRAQNKKNYFWDDQTNTQRGMRIYDYATMRIVQPSTATSCIIEIDSWISTDPATVITTQIYLTLQDNVWLLSQYVV